MLICDEMRQRYYADATPSYGEDNPEQIFERVVQEGSLYANWAMPLYSVPAILLKNHANSERDVCSCQKQRYSASSKPLQAARSAAASVNAVFAGSIDVAPQN